MLLSSLFVRRATCIALAFVMLMTALFVVAPTAQASGETWLEGWQHRKALTIQPHDGAGTNNQILFDLHNATGTDGSESLYQIEAWKIYLSVAHEDFREIRFTASDGSTPIDHWIWQYSSALANAWVWVEVPNDVSTTGTTIYLYWGNATATSTSNGAATFPWFSDFNDATDLVIDTPASVTFSDGKMTVGAGEAEFTGVYSDVAVSGPMSLIMRYSAATDRRTSGLCDYQGDAPSNAITIRGLDGDTWDLNNMYDGYESRHTVEPVAFNYTNLNIHELRWDSAGVNWNVNGELTGYYTESTATVPFYFITRGGYGNSQTFDYAFFYKIIPGWSLQVTIGTKESAAPTGLDPTFTASPTSGYAPLEVTFAPTNVGYEGYTWLFGDGNTSTATNPTHTYQQAGTFNVTLNVTSGGLYNESWSLVTVSLVPAITSTPVVIAAVGSSYSYAPVCNVAVASWSLETNATFLEINASTGLVTGEIGADGVGWYAMLITASSTPACDQTFVLTVPALPPPEPGTITSTPVTKGYVNQTYRYQVACTIAVTSWSINGADFLAISSGGLITGTPGADDLGNHTISVAAQTAAGTVWQNYTLDIRSSPVSTGATGLDDTIPMIVGALILVVVLAALGGMFAKVTTTLGKWRHRQ